MKNIHVLNVYVCSPLFCARGCDEGQDTALSQARCPLVSGSQPRGRQPSNRQVPSAVAGVGGFPAGSASSHNDLNTWLRPFLLFLLSFAVGASPSKHLMALLSQIF